MTLKEVKKNEVFKVKIRGQEFPISVDLLAFAFGVDNDGNRVSSFKELNRLRDYDESAFLETLVPNNNLSKERTSTASLS